MKRNSGILIGQIASVVLVAFLAKPGSASCVRSNGGGFPPHRTVTSGGPQQLAQEGLLAARLRKLQEAKIDEVAAEVKKNPKLVDDPKYLAQHTRLAGYLEKHPEAKDKIKQYPNAFFQHLKDEGRQGIGG